MEFRLAQMGDLPQIKAVFEDIIRDMNKRGIDIWDEVYPCAFFEEDIQERRLYVLLDGGTVVSAFALCGSNDGAGSLDWEDSGARALYFDRFGVNVAYAGGGIGSSMLARAKEAAKGLGAEYLRLFVVDVNEPAIRLYRKNGFQRVSGVYEEAVEEDFVLREYGYEVRLS